MYEHTPTSCTRTPHSHYTYITRHTTTLRLKIAFLERSPKSLKTGHVTIPLWLHAKEAAPVCKYYLEKKPGKTLWSIGINRDGWHAHLRRSPPRYERVLTVLGVGNRMSGRWGTKSAQDKLGKRVGKGSRGKEVWPAQILTQERAVTDRACGRMPLRTCLSAAMPHVLGKFFCGRLALWWYRCMRALLFSFLLGELFSFIYLLDICTCEGGVTKRHYYFQRTCPLGLN
jgi:hypothetical protein